MRPYLTSPALNQISKFSITPSSHNAIPTRQTVPAHNRLIRGDIQLATSSPIRTARRAEAFTKPFPAYASILTTSAMASNNQDPVENGVATPKQVFFLLVNLLRKTVELSY